MQNLPISPDLTNFEVPIDSWTQPFWDAAEKETILLPCCGQCQNFRWPPGPFCPHCQSQKTEWLPSGPAKLYSFTIVWPRKSEDKQSRVPGVPALVEFPDAGGVRIPAAIVDTVIEEIRIGADLAVRWRRAANVKIPVFAVS